MGGLKGILDRYLNGKATLLIFASEVSNQRAWLPIVRDIYASIVDRPFYAEPREFFREIQCLDF
jgi:hypothetical protein